MPSYQTAFGTGRYVRAGDLDGRDVEVVIERVALETVVGERGKESKLVVRFEGAQKGLVLNKVNADGLAAITGTDDYTRWAGTAVVLFVDPTVQFGGKTTGGVRLRAARHAQPFERPRLQTARVVGGREEFEVDPRPRREAPIGQLRDSDIPF